MVGTLFSSARIPLCRHDYLRRLAPIRELCRRTPAILSDAESSPWNMQLSRYTSGTNLQTAAASKGFFSRLWEKHSIQGQRKRIELADRLFRAAQHRSMDRVWYNAGRIGHEFRPKQAILTLHVWLLHKRLTSDKTETRDFSLLVQEELFDMFWNDTRTRIRAEGMHELTVNKHLKDVQQMSLQHCMHYDHAFSFEDDAKRREELANVVWTHILLRNEDVINEHIQRLVLYVEWEYDNIVKGLPETYFREGRIEWGDMMDFSGMRDNEGNLLPEVESDDENNLPDGWLSTLNEAGETYYWNIHSMETSWTKPNP